MNQVERLHGDLDFVRAAVERSTVTKSPAALSFVWAAIVAIGFSLVDFRPDWVPEYWTVAGPAGFLVSAYLGWRQARRIGQTSAADGRRHLFHWAAVLIVIALAVVLGIGNALPSQSLHTGILLLLSLGYFTAGLHLDRSFLWIGALLAAGAVVVTVVPLYAWTGVGVALAVSLTIVGIQRGRSLEAAA